MKRSMKATVIGLGVGALVLAGVTAEAKAPWVKEAQKLGFADAKDCMYCHVAKGKKDVNARGKFLVDQKTEKKAKDVDLNWLKDYKEAK